MKDDNENKTEEMLNDSAESTGASAPSPKKKRNKLKIIGAVAAVIVVLGVGFFVWHEQPSFCNAICHYSMDGYIDTLEATPGEATTDIWGNEVANASGMLAAVHATDADARCLTCHVPTLSEQVSEAFHWVAGSYKVPLDERGLSQLTAASGKQAAQFCTNDACHTEITLDADGSFEHDEGFINLLADKYAFNPHGWTEHHDNFASLECSDCHKSHRASVVYCTQCHSEAEIPEGWISYEDQKKLEYLYADLD